MTVFGFVKRGKNAAPVWNLAPMAVVSWSPKLRRWLPTDCHARANRTAGSPLDDPAHVRRKLGFRPGQL